VIRIGVIAYSVAIFFNNFGYGFEFLVVSGLIETMWRAVRDNAASADVPVSRPKRPRAGKYRVIPTHAP
jgi:hypothetical protein